MPAPRRNLLIGLLTWAMFALPGSVALANPSLSVQPAVWDFGNRDPSSGPSEPKIFTWTNTGDVGLSVMSEGIGSFNVDPNLFMFGERTCMGIELAPGGSCTTAITFNPSSPGRKHGTTWLYPQVPAPPEAVYAEAQLWGTGTGVENTPPLPSGPPIPAPRRVEFLHHPQHKTTNRSAVFRFQSLVGMRYACRLDGRRLAACHTPRRFAHLALGRHRLSIYAIDPEGREGPVTYFHWFIRTLPPTDSSRG